MSVDTVRVRRADTGREVEVSISEILWWLDLDKPAAAYGVVRRRQLRGDKPYIRKAPGSRWCTRVTFLDGGSGADPDGATTGADPWERKAHGTTVDPDGPSPSRLALAFRSWLGAEVRP